MKRAKTPTFLIELPLQLDWSNEKPLRAHLEAARCLYNALLGEANRRMRAMRTDPAWQAARAIPRTKKVERAQAFSRLRKQYHFSEYELHEFAKAARCSWIADHIDSTMAQTLATRAYQAVNRVCVGKAKRVRFRSKGRGIDSVEGKRNDVGMRFVFDPNAGDGGFLVWNKEVIPVIIDWLDPVVQHGLGHKIKYVRLIRRKASGPHAQGADQDGNRYFVQLVLEGHACLKKQHEQTGSDTVGLDIGPQTLAIVPREAKADLVTFCSELAPNAKKKRRLQRKMERQRRANNPDNYDEKGRVKKGKKRWKESKRYKATRRQHANAERRLCAHRKSLHGKLAHDIVKLGNTIHIEKTSFKGWQKQYGKSMRLRAPGMFVAHLARRVAKTGGTLTEVSAFKTKLSQYCHRCGRYVKKPRSQRWHRCSCGCGPVQRDLYSAFLLFQAWRVSNGGNCCLSSLHFTILPVPDILKHDVACVRIAAYSGEEAVAIKVSPDGVPGIVFHQNNGRSALEQIIIHSGRTSCPPPLFLYGAGIEPSVMRYKSGSFTTMQVIFKPHALKTLLGINASRLSNGWTDLHEFWAEDLESQLMEANNEQERMTFLTSFLVAKCKQAKPRDTVVEESLCLIHTYIGSIHVKDVLAYVHLSERQFERRFTQTVGLSPHAYIRVKRFHEAIRLIKTGQFERLTDVAYALNFSDQSHFIRDFKAFSGMTPTSLTHKADDLFYHDQTGYASLSI